MKRVQRGMRVIDADGEDVGRVEHVQMGDPEAATTAGNEEVPQQQPLDLVARALGSEAEPAVPEPLRSRLIRGGYLKVDGPNVLARDRYVPAEYVQSVSADRVQLRVRRAELVRED